MVHLHWLCVLRNLSPIHRHHALVSQSQKIHQTTSAHQMMLPVRVVRVHAVNCINWMKSELVFVDEMRHH